MNPPHLIKSAHRWWILPALIFPLLLVTACAGNPAAASAAEATHAFESALLTATYAVGTATATLTPQPAQPTTTSTPAPPTPDLNRTPPALPPVFNTSMINPKDYPHAYIQDTCEYLKLKWNPNNSPPGTVVMPIMFHGLTDAEVASGLQITHDYLVQLLRDLKSQGFETVTAEQLADFLERNAKIPMRSIILIVDDRHFPDYFRTHFIPQLEEYGWTVTNAFISHPNTSAELWSGNAQLAAEGWVDYQAHGVVHNIPISNFPPNSFIDTEVYGRVSADEFIHNELYGPIDAFEQHFGKRPIAYIWPGGGFSQKAVEVARQAGYRLGFTVNPRGPIMFNWIPLADETDPARPSWIPEGPVGDPLMVLPRYWDTDAANRIDEVRRLGKEAAAYAEQNKAVELEYYDIVCKSRTGEIPTLAP